MPKIIWYFSQATNPSCKSQVSRSVSFISNTSSKLKFLGRFPLALGCLWKLKIKSNAEYFWILKIPYFGFLDIWLTVLDFKNTTLGLSWGEMLVINFTSKSTSPLKGMLLDFWKIDMFWETIRLLVRTTYIKF